jgi:hypothetical protein
VIDLRHDEKSAWNEELIAGRIGAGSRDTRVEWPYGLEGGLAPQFRKSKAMKRPKTGKVARNRSISLNGA